MDGPYNPVTRIASTASLEDLAHDIQEDPDVARRITHLTITLHEPVSVDALRLCLINAPQVEDLILTLPPDTPLHVLTGIQLQHLELFSTNLPHRHLPAFLDLHPTVTDLCLGPCQRARGESCPLKDLELSHVMTVECPLDCTGAVTRPAIRRLTIEDLGYSTRTVPAVLQSLPLPLPSLFALTLDFYPDDYDVLDKIVIAAPRLQKLKLLEKPRVYRRESHSRRAWNDTKAWSRCLFKLDFLEELALRTASALVGSPSSVTAEKARLMKWTTIRPHGKRACGHPTLTFLRVWYRYSEPQGGISTIWSKSSGTWENILRTTSTGGDGLF